MVVLWVVACWFFVDCGHGGAGLWALTMVVVVVGGLRGGELSQWRWVWWVLISDGGYRGFLCLLVVVFVGFSLVFAGTLWLNWFSNATFNPRRRLGLCWVWFFGFEKWKGFRYGVKGFGLVFKRVLDVCNWKFWTIFTIVVFLCSGFEKNLI